MTPDEISCQLTGAGEAEIVLHLSADLFWFKGHFSVQPLLPGVAQLEWVMRYTTRLLTPDYRFHSIQNVKFQAPLLPGNRITLTLKWQEAHSVLAFSYQRHDGDARHTTSSGKIRLCR
ncbi:ApeI family dehydratase [Pseudocitrobacter cyperus]|uniref:Hydroxymyristoyl-ACP dehydratase n=1 Tax=Pseudocitrobacter cyperus TaxID=3112843 RepID=A0ABV0HLN3_9ENTR